MKLTADELALLGAAWWADKIENPQFDIGDDSEKAKWLIALTHLNVKNVSENAKRQFKCVLSEIIRVELTTNPETIFALEVDYHPDENLARAADIAGISPNNFPWKTIMWIKQDCLIVKYGYRGERQFLYANEEENQMK